MKEPRTLLEVIQYFSDAENCRQFMIFVRWPDGIVRCPRCGKESPAYLEKSKLYFCSAKHPKQKFSLKVGTIFEESPIGLEKWLPAAWLVGNCKNGISSYELARAIGVTQKSAWFMNHRIREAMQDDSNLPMGGPGSEVESDETFVGGKARNMSAKRRKQFKIARETSMGDAALVNKAAVWGVLDREQRKVRATVVPKVNREALQDAVLNQVAPGSKIYTDEAKIYRSLPKEYIHEFVNHMEEYVDGRVHTNGIENFWSLLKRGLKGTYVAVEPFHLHRYVDEQVFRYNNRATKDNPLTDADRFTLIMSQVCGKRLTYAELTGKDDATPERPF